jgi:hypothetical protein
MIYAFLMELVILGQFDKYSIGHPIIARLLNVSTILLHSAVSASVILLAGMGCGR